MKEKPEPEEGKDENLEDQEPIEEFYSESEYVYRECTPKYQVYKDLEDLVL